jgi:trans-aconitate methyltransferase
MTAETTAQHWDPDRYARNARFVAELGAPVLDWLHPQPGERILDLGCGDGALTVRLQEMGCDVVGVDASGEQIAAARQLGLDARVVDGQALPFDAEFDAVFSNAALHWMKRDPDAVIGGVARALKPGGRFVAEMGGGANVAAIRGALEAALRRRDIDPAPLCPWYFPTPAAYRARLEAAGFAVDRIELFPRPTPLPSAMVDWLDTFGDAYLAAVPAAERGAVKDEVSAALAPALRDERGQWIADYVRLRFAARLPE